MREVAPNQKANIHFSMQKGNENHELGTLSLSPWPRSASELYRPSNYCLLVRLVPTFADTGCCMVSTMDTYGRVLAFLDRSHYYFFQIAPQLYSRG
jgi:hypothetical protein